MMKKRRGERMRQRRRRRTKRSSSPSLLVLAPKHPLSHTRQGHEGGAEGPPPPPPRLRLRLPLPLLLVPSWPCAAGCAAAVVPCSSPFLFAIQYSEQ